MKEEREAILELLKICKWLAGDDTWQSVWDKIEEIETKWKPKNKERESEIERNMIRRLNGGYER